MHLIAQICICKRISNYKMLFMRTIIKMKSIVLLLAVMSVCGIITTKACDVHAGFTYSIDTATNFTHFNFTSTSDTTIYF